MARPVLPRTKIVATLGPACDDDATLDRMVRAGLSVARINLAHGTYDDHARFVRRVRQAARRANRAVAVLVDLAGPKIRIGDLQGGKLTLEPGRRLRLTTERVMGDRNRISVTEKSLPRDVRRGDPIFLADGTLELVARSVRGHEIECEVVTGGLLLPAKGVNLPHTRLRLPSLTAKDRRDLTHVLQLGIDALALSFVRDADDLERLRKLLGRRRIPLIAKIEKREAIENLDPILAAADGAMVARGDLAVETSLEELPLLQKSIIRHANDAGKPVITATQMLLSMVDQERPTRAEAADIANAILDGTDAVMLSEETARGRHPAKAVETMARIAVHAEAALDPEAFGRRTERHAWVASAVSEAAVEVAHRVGAAAIVTPTFAGATTRFVARLRPRMPVVALSQSAPAIQFLCFSWGVHPVHRPGLGSFDETLKAAGAELRRLGLARPGDRYVVTASYPRRNTSNLMSVQVLGRR
jgi:pyruvate kinase